MTAVGEATTVRCAKCGRAFTGRGTTAAERHVNTAHGGGRLEVVLPDCQAAER